MRYVTSFRAIWEGGQNGRWNSAGERTDPVIVSYHFNDVFEVPSVWELDEYAAYVDPMDRFQQSVVRAQLEKLEDAAGVRFVEVDNPDLAMMTFSIVGGSDYGGWAYLPVSYDDYTSTSDIFIDETGISFSGEWARGVILHEVMHALGLTHPHEGRFRLYDWMDKPSYTLMTYNGFDDKLGSLDVQALRHIYGPSIDRADLRFKELLDGLRITGSAADDTIIGVKGNGELIGAAGDDALIGREDNDLLHGGAGQDVLSGLHGRDRLLGGSGRDDLFGGAGDDILFGQSEADLLEGGAGDDRLSGGDGNDRMFGRSGDDAIKGGTGDDMLAGGAWSDALSGGAGNDTLFGGTGFDELHGGRGGDTLVGGGEADSLWGEGGMDLLQGGAGDDVLGGGALGDVLEGGAGRDSLSGGAGRDQLFGGEGADTLRGEAGADEMTGGGGSDTFLFHAGDGAGMDLITDFELGIDRLGLGSRGFASFTLREAQGGASVDLLFEDAGQQLRLEGITRDAFTDHYALD